MGRILETVESFLTADEWPYTLIDENLVCKTGFEGKNGQFTCFAQERAEQEQLVFYSILPVRAAKERIPAAAEFITRANFGMIIGNFELDYQDGEIRYKTSVDVEDTDLAESLVQNLVYANVLTMDKYLPGLMRVLYAGVEPTAAIEEVEGEGD